MHIKIVNANLSATSHINWIVAHCLINFIYLMAYVPLSGHDDVANDTESTQKSKIKSLSLV